MRDIVRGSAATSDWTIVVPVKGSALSKSRFGDDERRLELAQAMALDTVEAAAAVAPVVVIGGPALSLAFGDFARVMVEQPGDGLNGAIERALLTIDGPVAVLLGDLPALLPDELDVALQDNILVADSNGTGTTLVTGRRVAFGAGSRAAHLALGYRELEVPAMSGLRLDIDSVADLAAIQRERLGRRTLRLLD